MGLKWITMIDMIALIIGAIGAGMLVTPSTQFVGGVLVAIAAGFKAFQKKMEETNTKKITKEMS